MLDSYQLALQNNNDARASMIHDFIQQAIDTGACDAVIGSEEDVTTSTTTATATILTPYEIPVGIQEEATFCFLDSGPVQGGFVSQLQNISNADLP